MINQSHTWCKHHRKYICICFRMMSMFKKYLIDNEARDFINAVNLYHEIDVYHIALVPWDCRNFVQESPISEMHSHASLPGTWIGRFAQPTTIFNFNTQKLTWRDDFDENYKAPMSTETVIRRTYFQQKPTNTED